MKTSVGFRADNDILPVWCDYRSDKLILNGLSTLMLALYVYTPALAIWADLWWMKVYKKGSTGGVQRET